MNENHIARLEARLEQFVEGAFTNLFRKDISTHDIAVKLARSMESGLRTNNDGNSRPVAPDRYTIQVSAQAYEHLQRVWITLSDALTNQMVELATQSGYRLLHAPVIKLVVDQKLGIGDVDVRAMHTKSQESGTQAMQPMGVKRQAEAPENPQLIVNNERIVALVESLVNVGRSADNHIMIDDPLVSRHHLQIRLRFGIYTLFDANSSGGTFVNNVRVAEHRLQPGDVIRIGNTQLTYVIDDDRGRSDATTTQTLEPVE